MKDNVIFIIIESYSRYIFFYRMHESLVSLGFIPFYLTLSPVVYLKLKKIHCNIYLFRKVKKVINKYHFGKKTTLDVAKGDISDISSERIALMIVTQLKELSNKYDPKVVFIYNGTTLLTSVAADFFHKENVPTAFFELANLPGKMFVDPMGTNANSLLYKNIKVLKDFDVNFKDFELWKESYLKESKTVKQATFGKNSFKDYTFFALDRIYFIYFIDSIDEKISYFKKYFDRFKKRFFYKSSLLPVNKIISPYIFFPMQVSDDSQLLIHSKIRNLEAIKKGCEEAKKLDVKLVIKMHPAEKDYNYIKEIFKMKKNYSFDITSEDTFTLIKNADKVITINSTVALESIILNKEVKILGKSFYKNFIRNEQLLSKYILGYLIDINYFSYESIDRNIILKCIERAKLSLD